MLNRLRGEGERMKRGLGGMALAVLMVSGVARAKAGVEKPVPKSHKAEYAAAWAAIAAASASAYFDVQSTRSKQLQYPGRYPEAGSPVYRGDTLVPRSSYLTLQIPTAAMAGVLGATRGHSRAVSWAIVGFSVAYSVWHFQAAMHNRGLR